VGNKTDEIDEEIECISLICSSLSMYGFSVRWAFLLLVSSVPFGNAAVPEVQINDSFYVFGYAKK